MNVLILLAEGFEEIEVTISVDMLRRAGLNVIIASISDSIIVEGSRKIKIDSDILLKDFKGLPETVILPGGLPGAENLANSSKVTELIKGMDENDKLIAAICASPAVVLAPMGILDNRKATCYPGFEEKFSENTTYVDEKVVVEGNIITSRGPGTAFDFALEIIKYLKNEDIANEVKEQTLVR